MTPLDKQNLHISALVIGALGAFMIIVASYTASLAQTTNDAEDVPLSGESGLTTTVFEYWGVNAQCISSTNPQKNGRRVSTAESVTCHTFSSSDFTSSKRKSQWRAMFSLSSLGFLSSIAFIILLFVSLFHMSASCRQSLRWGTMGLGIFFVLAFSTTLILFRFWNQGMVRDGKLPTRSDLLGKSWEYGPGFYSTITGMVLVGVSTILTGMTTSKTTIVQTQ
jgi:ABC-type multidrug transport system fused ATPase/permease subunit